MTSKQRDVYKRDLYSKLNRILYTFVFLFMLESHMFLSAHIHTHAHAPTQASVVMLLKIISYQIKQRHDVQSTQYSYPHRPCTPPTQSIRCVYKCACGMYTHRCAYDQSSAKCLLTLQDYAPHTLIVYMNNTCYKLK